MAENFTSSGERILDSRGEILARRGLIRRLYSDLIKGELKFFVKTADSIKYQLRPNVKFHLYISSICLTESDADAEAVYSMSIPAKILRWNVLGLQGALLSGLIEQPIHISSLIVGKKVSYANLYHKVGGRLEDCAELAGGLNKPDLLMVTATQARPKESATDSIGWCQGDKDVEIIDGFTGEVIRLHPKVNSFVFGAAKEIKYSRMSKKALFTQFCQLDKTLPDEQSIYGAVKRQATKYQEDKAIFLAGCAKSDLGPWIEKPFLANEFTNKN